MARPANTLVPKRRRFFSLHPRSNDKQVLAGRRKRFARDHGKPVVHWMRRSFRIATKKPMADINFENVFKDYYFSKGKLARFVGVRPDGEGRFQLTGQVRV